MRLALTARKLTRARPKRVKLRGRRNRTPCSTFFLQIIRPLKPAKVRAYSRKDIYMTDAELVGQAYEGIVKTLVTTFHTARFVAQTAKDPVAALSEAEHIFTTG